MLDHHVFVMEGLCCTLTNILFPTSHSTPVIRTPCRLPVLPLLLSSNVVEDLRLRLTPALLVGLLRQVKQAHAPFLSLDLFRVDKLKLNLLFI